jgi:hypothetical protein
VKRERLGGLYLPVMPKAVVLVALLAGCEWIDAATAERPSSDQSGAVGDIFVSVGAFASVVADPVAADTGDLADIHAIAPYRTALDPGDASARRVQPERRSLDGCVETTENSATWSCGFALGGVECLAEGSGSRAADGTVSGSSTQTCGADRVTVTATSVIFDEASGRGSGLINVDVGDASYATLTIDGLGFCLDQADVLPNAGRVIIDGEGELDGLPFDPLTLAFSDTPACGAITIE